MARRSDGADQALVEVKAVDAAYPLFGAVAVEGGGDCRHADAEAGTAFSGRWPMRSCSRGSA